MTIFVYNIEPSWIFTQENKPSMQLFKQILQNAQISTCNPQFIEHPNSFNIKIRLSTQDVFNYKWNLVEIDHIFYKVTNVEILQQKTSSTNTIINIEAEIDLYLSYVVNLFDENSTSTIPVYFKQKHLNRWDYTGAVVNFSRQFYLLNMHENLQDIGKNLQKSVDIVNNSWYSVNNLTPDGFKSEAMLTYNNNYAYCYALFKMSPNETAQTQMLNGVFWNGLVNIAYTNNNNTISWWALFQVAAEQYLDLIILPVAIEYANFITGINWNSNANPSQTPWTIIENLAPQQISSQFNNVNALGANPSQLAYILNEPPANINNASIFSDIFWLEPYILSYCKFRTRGAGEDAFVDLNFFNNITPTTFINTLYSFIININHPTTQITNVSVAYLNDWINGDGQNYDYFYMQPFGYNNSTDAFYVLNWKAIYPSSSNNWTNYLMNNLNQYHTALNVAHYALQNSQAQIAFGALSGIGSAIGDFFEGKWGSMASSIGGTVEGLTSSSFAEMSQQKEYNYLKTGKKQDMSRVANERLATNNNVISYQNYLLSFIFEYPVKYEQIIVANYCALNGYVLEHWDLFKYWNNRIYCNYIKACYFADTLLSDLIVSYKKSIDELLNGGIRVWNNAAYNFVKQTLNINTFLVNNNTYLNAELNPSSAAEIDYINGVSND